MDKKIQIIHDAYNAKYSDAITDEVKLIVSETISDLDSGKIRVANKIDNEWIVNQWVKKAILLSFRINQNKVMEAGYTKFYDKLNSKFTKKKENYFKDGL